VDAYSRIILYTIYYIFYWHSKFSYLYKFTILFDFCLIGAFLWFKIGFIQYFNENAPRIVFVLYFSLFSRIVSNPPGSLFSMCVYHLCDLSPKVVRSSLILDYNLIGTPWGCYVTYYFRICRKCRLFRSTSAIIIFVSYSLFCFQEGSSTY